MSFGLASTSSNIPQSQQAVVQDATGQPIFISNLPLPILYPGTVLVRTRALAINPFDFKMGTFHPCPGTIIGNDFAGVVVELGPPGAQGTNTSISIGDSVFGTVHGSNATDKFSGAFAEFVRADLDLLLRLPSGLKYEDAVTLGLSLTTSFCALCKEGLGLDLEQIEEDSSVSHNSDEMLDVRPQKIPVLVYGASTSVGATAIQLLRLAGFAPLATCSSHNFDMVRDRGATAVFDHSAPGAAVEVSKQAGGQLHHALDCIVDETSITFCNAAMGRTGGRCACLELWPPGIQRPRRAVRTCFVMALEVFGKEVSLPGDYHRSANLEKRALAIQFLTRCQKLLDAGLLQPHPKRIIPGRLSGVLEGIRLLKSGCISGTKLVVSM
ncbi:putative zinc-binding dehydrogenase family oxidoreductase [Xylariaceae sp. FL1019]|nr:putative zinc-binding dehydrogenase family oxidoreductase [Xylariaceae sp. FL1019]